MAADQMWDVLGSLLFVNVICLIPTAYPIYGTANVLSSHASILCQHLMLRKLTVHTSPHLYHSLSKFSRQQTDNIFSYFSKKIGFDISYKLSPLGWYLHWRQFAWNVKTCFLGKFRKISSNFQQKTYWQYFSYFSQKTGFDISCKLYPVKNKKNIITAVICWISPKSGKG